MTTLLIAYLLGILPGFIFYARWMRWIENGIMDPYPNPFFGETVVLGCFLASLWPIAWVAVVLGALGVGINPFGVSWSWPGRVLDWIGRHLFRGL